MKKVVFSIGAKITAFVVMLICIWFCVSLSVSIGYDLVNSEYRFEDSFRVSQKANSVSLDLISNTEAILTDLLNGEIDLVDFNRKLTDLGYEYCLNSCGVIYSNTSDKEKEKFYADSIGFSYEKHDAENSIYTMYGGRITLYTAWDECLNKKGSVALGIDPFNGTTVTADKEDSHKVLPRKFEFSVRYEKSIADDILTQWNSDAKRITENLNVVLILLFTTLLFFIYLLVVCGRRNGESKACTLPIDRYFVEINLAVLTLVCVATVVFVIFPILNMVFGNPEVLNPVLVSRVFSAVAVFISGVICTEALSIARCIKSKTLVKKSIVLSAIIIAWRLLIKALKYVFGLIKRLIIGFRNGRNTVFKALKKRTFVYVALLFTGYTAAMYLMTFILFVDENKATFIPYIAVIVYALGVYLLSRLCLGFDNVRTGLNEIRNGNVDFRIKEEKGIMGELAVAVNSVGEGLKTSVEKQITAERMKAELVTNVSHDLKTPLTSIMNYAKLLCNENLQPSVANDYAKIILQKSERLKNLTQDLFDISKVQSGNENIELETLDVAILIRQIAGEHSDALSEKGLTLLQDVPDESKKMQIVADGKKLSRVMENLFVNVEKYSMAGTRVYLSCFEVNGKIVVELKNISAYPLNFDVDEITERFVRGEKSRSTDGNGLGLAIAKSYTELCNGRFILSTDADLFKVTLEFDKA